jgi:UDP-2,3-diacylglucosamine pyrophosphatase LpxH
MAKKYFITSDVHSFFDELTVALEENGFDIHNRDHILCICGDLFDRGNQTVELFEFIRMARAQNRLIYVRGNHEDLLFDCMHDIKCGKLPREHHFHNQTVKTICQFCGENEWIVYDPTCRDKICETMQPILDWINENTVDYAEIGDYVLVHGWLPCYQCLDDFRNASKKDWMEARWDNGMEMWSYPRCRVEGKTVICGHFHCSWGWSHLRQERKEFPTKNRIDWEKSFEPFVDDGIIALDSCCAYSGKLNCIVIEG